MFVGPRSGPYRSTPWRQFLVYIGGDSLTMSDGIDEPELLDYHYGLVDMHRINCVDVKQLPSYIIGYEDGEARGEVRHEALIVRRLLTRFNTEEVAALLGLEVEHVARIEARGRADGVDSEG